MTAPYREFDRGPAVMITGGLGFIGSNLARELVAYYWQHLARYIDEGANLQVCTS